MKKLPIALQVYSVREEAEKDFLSTMKSLKEMGYDGVELAGLYGHQPQEVKQWLQEAGLKAVSAHVPYSDLKERLVQVVEDYALIGCAYIAIPYLSEEERYGTKYQEFLNFIPQVSSECKKRGITLLYHNHDFEFEKVKEGKYFLDSLYETFSTELLMAEIDTCWVQVVGESPAEYIKKYVGRCPIIHIKDYIKEEKTQTVPLGQGLLMVQEIVQAVCESKTEWLVIEQDEHVYNTPLENVKASIKYLKSILN